MTPLGRALIGAALGAVATLLVHPLSRPFLATPLGRSNVQRLESCLDFSQRKIDAPTNLFGASLWLQVAAERVGAGPKLTDAEVSNVVDIAKAAEAKEPSNAYWFQMDAVLNDLAGKSKESMDAWRRGARCTAWNDFQTRRLLQARDRIAKNSGSPQAWQLGYVYFARSDAAARLIERYAQTVLENTTTETQDGIQTRFATLRNGALLRNGSQSMTVGLRGADIVELSTYPSKMTKTPSPKRLWVAETKFISDLQKDGLANESRLAQDAFKANDAWRAMTQRVSYEENVRTLSVASLATSAAPGIILGIAAMGFAIWFLGWAVDRFAGMSTKFGIVPALISSLVVGMIVYFITAYPIAAISTALCFLFIVVGPKHGRTTKVVDLGPLFTFCIVILATAFLLTLALHFSGTTTAALAVLPEAGVPPEYYGGSSLFVGLSAIIFGLLFLMAPFWAVAQRLPTPYVLSMGLKRFGAILGFGCLFLSAIIGPLMIYADGQITEEMSKIVGNEPIYYLLQ